MRCFVQQRCAGGSANDDPGPTIAAARSRRLETIQNMKMQEIAAADLPDHDTFVRRIAEPCTPIVIRGLVREWPLTQSAMRSPQEVANYLRRFDKGSAVEVFVGDARNRGRYYYTDDLKQFNFERRHMNFGEALDAILAAPEARSVYLGSLPVDLYLSGLETQNVLPTIRTGVAPRIWIGHESNVASHYDTLDNVACVVAGRRRFTLYAPTLIGDLYVGPIDHTMAGQPVSLAASSAPGDPRYPRFEAIRDRALVTELEPGDAIYIPKLWWHQVEATERFNVLVNYWWDAFSIGPDVPSAGLLLSMIAIAERPLAERLAWKAFFDHYVFRPERHPLEHLPPEQHGVLGPLKPHNYAKLRAFVMQLLRTEGHIV